MGWPKDPQKYEEARKKSSEAKTGKNNPMFEKYHTEKTKQKISKALMGN